MTRTRIALTTFVAFFVSQVMAVLIHGFVLAADYEPFDGTLLRSGADAWQFIFLPVAHLAFICGLVWVYTHAQLTGSRARQGLTLGVVGWITGQVPVWLLWYAEQPWPGSLVVKQLGLELVSSLLIAFTIVFIARQSASAPVLADCTKMSPPEDGSAGSLTWGKVATPVIVRLTGHVRSGMTLGKYLARSPQG